MGNRRLHKIERFHTPGTSESERLKVAALNLFHPTASPPFPKNRFFQIAAQSLYKRGGGGDFKKGDDGRSREGRMGNIRVIRYHSLSFV
jgi:hypothetical protein